MTEKTDPRQTTADAVRLLRAPVQGLEAMGGSRRRHSVFVGGGCLFWAFALVFIYMFVMIKYAAIMVYVAGVLLLRVLYVLACLVQWGWVSEAGVIRRRSVARAERARTGSSPVPTAPRHP